jgi:hypothetical protein
MAKPDYFASRCKGGETGSPRDLSRGVDRRRRKIVGRRHCLTGPFMGRSPSQRPRRGPDEETASSFAHEEVEPCPITPFAASEDRFLRNG